MVAQLRQKGVAASDVVRNALRAEYLRQGGGQGAPLGPVELLLWLRERHAAPAAWKGRQVHAWDRKEVAAFLRKRLKAKRKRRVMGEERGGGGGEKCE